MSKKVLVACEYSQIVTSAFLEVGADAYSCDIIDTTGPYPKRHYKMDALKCIQQDKWDLVIAHPPCTYLSNVSAPWIKPKGIINFDRWLQLISAKNFFLKFFEVYTGKLCVENPRPLTMAELPPYTQLINPVDFGSQYHKYICLWLRDLPPLLPTHARINNSISWHNTHNGGYMRSRFFEEVAKAMAEQWYPLL